MKLGDTVWWVQTLPVFPGGGWHHSIQSGRVLAFDDATVVTCDKRNAGDVIEFHERRHIFTHENDAADQMAVLNNF